MMNEGCAAAEDARMIQSQTSDAIVACIYFPEKLGYSAHRAQADSAAVSAADCCMQSILGLLTTFT